MELFVNVKLLVLNDDLYPTVRHGCQVGPESDQIGAKWDKSGIFKDQFSVHFGSVSQNVLLLLFVRLDDNSSIRDEGGCTLQVLQGTVELPGLWLWVWPHRLPPCAEYGTEL